jgi:hypothetical protein
MSPAKYNILLGSVICQHYQTQTSSLGLMDFNDVGKIQREAGAQKGHMSRRPSDHYIYNLKHNPDPESAATVDMLSQIEAAQKKLSSRS